ncbi:MAG: RHS repeat-associated core domain-containing protein [Candidatus Omnitrophota bacterium]|nr:RHS repeat-associated core domain-containing protein [Candidatus Omnitrophota bacterium]
MIKQGNVYYYSVDGLGSVVTLTDTTGTTAETYTYDEYGNLTSAPSQVGNRYLYTGREYDPETGLYYYRARYYDSKIGRFLQTDPIGYSFDINLYSYCSNNSVNYTDWSGLSGTLTIYSMSGNNESSGSVYGDHSWQSYKKDDSNDTTYYGTWRSGGLRENDALEEKWSTKDGVAKREKHIDDAQEKKLDKAIKEEKAKGEGAWSPWSPCPDFATDTWKKVTGENLQDRHLGGFGYSDPNVLVKSINKANQNDQNNQNNQNNKKSK